MWLATLLYLLWITVLALVHIVVMQMEMSSEMKCNAIYMWMVGMVWRVTTTHIWTMWHHCCTSMNMFCKQLATDQWPLKNLMWKPWRTLFCLVHSRKCWTNKVGMGFFVHQSSSFFNPYYGENTTFAGLAPNLPVILKAFWVPLGLKWKISVSRAIEP